MRTVSILLIILASYSFVDGCGKTKKEGQKAVTYSINATSEGSAIQYAIREAKKSGYSVIELVSYHKTTQGDKNWHIRLVVLYVISIPEGRQEVPKEPIEKPIWKREPIWPKEPREPFRDTDPFDIRPKEPREPIR